MPRSKPAVYAIGLAFALCFQLAHAAGTITGRVVGIADGDTITVLTAERQQFKIRLAQIDAPEKSQDFGQVSKQALSDLVYGKDVTIEVETIDKYGRTVGTVMVGGVDANLQQVKAGLAWVYTKYAHEQAYYAAEDAAKAAKAGLWSRPDAIPPWDYRHGNKNAGATSGGNGLLAKLKGWMTPGTAATGAATGGDCGAKRYCKEMDSCQEAMHYLNDCGLSRLDRDGDGKPCESFCK